MKTDSTLTRSSAEDSVDCCRLIVVKRLEETLGDLLRGVVIVIVIVLLIHSCTFGRRGEARGTHRSTSRRQGRLQIVVAADGPGRELGLGRTKSGTLWPRDKRQDTQEHAEGGYGRFATPVGPLSTMSPSTDRTASRSWSPPMDRAASSHSRR
jgi:hypothetical protein